MTARLTISVAVGSVIGALSRWLALLIVSSEDPSWILILVNGTGCGVMGWLVGSRRHRSALGLGATAGFCGALTTFAGFALDTAKLIDAQRVATALGYGAGTLSISFLAFAITHAVAERTTNKP
jgi:fluoride exporter